MVIYFLQNGSVEPCLLLSTGFVVMRALMLDKTARPAPGTSVVSQELLFALSSWEFLSR